MLALLSSMTLTQVSTWFANARRRLKKEKNNRQCCYEEEDKETFSIHKKRHFFQDFEKKECKKLYDIGFLPKHSQDHKPLKQLICLSTPPISEAGRDECCDKTFDSSSCVMFNKTPSTQSIWSIKDIIGS